MNTNENTTSTETAGKKTSLAQKIAAGDFKRTLRNLEEALEHGKLNSWETGFVADMVGKMKQYGLKTRVSMRQVVMLSRITIKHAIAA
jgi:hypothetical protein